MKTLKKIALIMLSVMMICSMSVFAADSPVKQTLTTSLKKAEFTYNGKKQAPKASQVVVKVNGKKLSAKDYKVTIKKGKDAGKYTVTVKILKGKCAGLKQNATYTIKKASQKVKVSKSTINVKASKVAKKAVSQKVKVTKKAGKVSYKTNNANIKVKNGKIVVAKGTKKDTYKVTVYVKGAKNYKDAKKVITVKVK